ncbi:VWFA and cache domain-containing protein 1 [Galendromus occidentalis]|uniref:VWFA and cache domain-containing protein 1 n=1 Tax=Galendromus occidentalis TaxID=34638 RepID=A0AAJ7SDR8_9ACAR|nr:VWFA and cache domain-containing protein 1 [Galendromus occidentalis]
MLKQILCALVVFVFKNSVVSPDPNEGRASLLSQHLKRMSQSHLKLADIQANLDRLSFAPAPFDRDEIFARTFGSLKRKHRELYTVLANASQEIHDLMHQTAIDVNLPPQFCCDMDTWLKMDPIFGAEIAPNTTCSPSREAEPFHDLRPVFNRIATAIPAAKWQFLITQKTHIEFPAQVGSYCGDITRHRSAYARAVRPRTKNIVVLLDHGGATGQQQLTVGKAIARFFVQSLSPQDRIAVIAVADTWSAPRDCHILEAATDETVHRVLDFIERLKPVSNNTNHREGFAQAFEYLRRTRSPSEDGLADALIAFISVGKLSHLNDRKDILNFVNLRRRELKSYRVIINTYMLGDPKKSIVFAQDYLKAIAETAVDPQSSRGGRAYVVNSTDMLMSTAGQFVEAFLPSEVFPPLNYSTPWFEPITRQLMVTVALPIRLRGMNSIPDGVLGVDLPLQYFVEDFQLPEQTPDRFAFMVNTDTGHVMSHPHFVPSKAVALEAAPPLISSLEPQLPPLMMYRKTRIDLFDAEPMQYSWRFIEGTPFSVFVAFKISGRYAVTLRSVIPLKEIAARNLIYHRLDLLPHIPKCLYGGQVSTMQGFGVFLSPTAFASPFSHLNSEETKQSVRDLTKFIFDRSNLMGNPGIVKQHIKEEIRLLAYLTKDWNLMAPQDFMVRRYVASSKGVVISQPATMVPKRFDPSTREWFVHAADLRDRTVITGPYLDVAGYGQIVTVSRAYVKQDNVIAVVAMDLNVGYLNKLITDLFPECDTRSTGWAETSCFLMDNKGYVVSHQTLVDPTILQHTAKTPIEEHHIAHKEPAIANEILSLKNFSKKSACVSPSDRSVQRTYDLRLSLANALPNLISGELSCKKYQISAVSHTNVFLGLVNRTCEGVHAFTPCGVNDRGCLNCKRMAQEDPECPCECSIGDNWGSDEMLCSSDSSPSADIRDLDLCPAWFRAQDTILPNFSSLQDTLLPCSEANCPAKSNPSECFELSSCSWCVANLARVPLDQPNCLPQSSCYGGILNGPSPYDSLVTLQILVSWAIRKVFGPVLAVMVVIGVVIGVAKFTCKTEDSPYSYPGRDQNMPLCLPSDLDVDQITNQTQSAGVQANLLLNSYGSAVAGLGSPYRYPGQSYRIRPTAPESDLGYSSTVTPSTETAPSRNLRRATSCSSGRASSPSECSSSTADVKKIPSVITTTAQIHFSEADLNKETSVKKDTVISESIKMKEEIENGADSEMLANTADLIENSAPLADLVC